MMKISAAAYTGSPSHSTISLLLNLKGTTAVALADTGSTNTFMDYKFAVKQNILLTPVPAKTVTVAGGGILISEYIAHKCPFEIQGVEFCTEFRILELQGADAILGVNWFT